MLPLSEKVKVLGCIRKKKKHVEVMKMDTFSSHEIVKKEKEICASFVTVPTLQKLRPQSSIFA